MTPTPHVKFRLDPRDRLTLLELSAELECSRTEVVRRAIRELKERVEADRQECRQRGAEAVALFRRLQDRLGEQFFAGCGDVVFEATPKGRVAVRVGDDTYFEDEGEIIRARTRGGRAEYARIGPEGEAWLGMAPLAPAGVN